MQSNNIFIKIEFVSHSVSCNKYKGYVLYEFIDGKLNDQKWFVTESDIKGPEMGNYNSISAISKAYDSVTIKGAFQNRYRAAVKLKNNLFFYSILPATSTKNSVERYYPKKKREIAYWESIPKKEIKDLKHALENIKGFKEKFNEYNRI